MEKLVKGDIVVIPFPFSDLSGSKKRPAFVLADLTGDDIILCQITSQHHKDDISVSLVAKDFSSGSLPVDSFIKFTKIFTADKSIIIRKAGTVKVPVSDVVIKHIIELLKK
jgi:mRNA interferase MazF